MPKMKSHSGAAKRFKKTPSGNVKRGQSHRSHILTKKSTKGKRRLRDDVVISPADKAAIDRMLPHEGGTLIWQE